MRHLLKHMFAVQVVILMIFCAHICTAAAAAVTVPINGNFMANATAAPATVELTREMHKSNKNETMATPNAFYLKLDTSAEKSLQNSPVILREVEESHDASNGTTHSNEQT